VGHKTVNQSVLETSHTAGTSTRWHFAFSLHACCHSTETRARAPTANPPNSAQLEGTPYHSPNLYPGPCSSVGTCRGTDRHTQRRPWPQYISPRLHLTRNV